MNKYLLKFFILFFVYFLKIIFWLGKYSNHLLTEGAPVLSTFL